MKSLVSLVILITVSIFWYGFQNKGVNATLGSEASANFSGANMTGANLTGVILDGVIFCNTTMPDGTINNGVC